MAKITRYNGNLLPFAQNFTGGNRTIFGETTQSNDITDNINTKFLQGWEATTDANTFPTKQDFNAVAYVSTVLASYLHQVGIPEWNGEQEYHLNSFSNFGGILYRCKTNNHTSITDPASDATNWESVTGNFVSKTGNETIAGIKTFTSSPIVPTATTSTQAVNKGQLDNAVDGIGGKVLQVVSTTISAQGSTSITTADTASNPEISHTITPIGNNSHFKIEVRWFGETAFTFNIVAHIHRDGSRINEANTLNYHGLSMATQTGIGPNDASTPEILTLSTLDKTGSTAGTPITYKLMFSGSQTTTMWTNRCFDTPTNGTETGISEIIITEIGA